MPAASFRKPPRSHTHRIADSAQLVWLQMREQGAPVNGNPNLVDLNMRDAINAVFPENHVTGAGGKKRGTGKNRVTTAAHERAITFHAEISIYLKYSGMVTLTRKPAPHADGGPRPSRWALATDWLDIPDEVVLARARATHDTLEADCVNPYHATLATAELVGHTESDAQVTPEPEAVSVSLRTANGEHEMTVVTASDTVVMDPLTAVQAILTQNAELAEKVRKYEAERQTVAEINKELIEVKAERDQLRRDLAAKTDSARAMSDRWDALRALLEMDSDR